jgi:hypothetical protein
MNSEILEIQDKKDYLLVSFIGEFNLDAGQRTIDRVLEACIQYNLSKVLLDCRRMTGPLSITDRFLVVDYGQVMLGKVLAMVIVGRPDQILPNRFEETVAMNRGINLRVFDDIELAIEYLMS